MSNQNEPTQSGALPSVPLQPVVRWPDRPGFWWVNDKARYGWQPIEVVRFNGGFRMYEFGCNGPMDIPTYWHEFVRIYPPNPAVRGRESASVPCTGVVGPKDGGK